MAYLPYNSVRIRWLLKGAALSLRLPWTPLNIKSAKPESSWIPQTASHLLTPPFSQPIQKFLRSLKAYAVAYRVLRKKNEVQHFSSDALQTPLLEVRLASELGLQSRKAVEFAAQTLELATILGGIADVGLMIKAGVE